MRKIFLVVSFLIPMFFSNSALAGSCNKAWNYDSCTEFSGCTWNWSDDKCEATWSKPVTCEWDGRDYPVGEVVTCWDCTYKYCECLDTGKWGKCSNTHPDDDWQAPGGDHESWATVYCESKGRDYETCSVHGTIDSLYVDHQISNTKCKLNKNYGYRNSNHSSYIWVDDGCRAKFRVKLQD